MTRVLRLTTFAIIASIVVVGLLWTFRGRILAPFGMSIDTGTAGQTTLALPEGFTASVFASGLASPRFMAVAADGTLFVADPGR